MKRHILVLGGTGMLGRPVVNRLVDEGHRVRVLTRRAAKTRARLGDAVELAEGTVERESDLRAAMVGCDAVHINLTPTAEYAAMRAVIALAQGQLDRISYVSATTLSEENRWFARCDIKMRTEELLRGSGIPHVIFRPTWVMETLHNFIRGKWAIVLLGNNPPPLHFFAAADFGRIVAASYDDDRGVGKALYVYGPEAVTLSDATQRFIAACHPDVSTVRMKPWLARIAARLLRNPDFRDVTELVAYLDVAGEHGDPSEANALYGAPSITLDQWFRTPMDSRQGMPH
ncbi:MAG: NAD-dependent epimerase/dehydratase family protein [Myxococcales bacterium FL481]|nr:MAG: NAD-dependent epimerase/dehydratase family protein [Myxococcales bacterium FL481]